MKLMPEWVIYWIFTLVIVVFLCIVAYRLGYIRGARMVVKEWRDYNNSYEEMEDL